MQIFPRLVGPTILAALLVGVVGWLTCGVYADREFGEWHFFVKPRLSPIFYFYAPAGESDLDERALGEADRRAERRFREFVEGQNGASVKTGR